MGSSKNRHHHLNNRISSIVSITPPLFLQPGHHHHQCLVIIIFPNKVITVIKCNNHQVSLSGITVNIFPHQEYRCHHHQYWSLSSFPSLYITTHLQHINIKTSSSMVSLGQSGFPNIISEAYYHRI